MVKKDQDYEKLDNSSCGRRIHKWLKSGTIVVCLVVVYCSLSRLGLQTTSVASNQCPIPEYVYLESFSRDNTTLHKIIFDPVFRNASASKLAGAVRIRTDIGDDAPGVKENPKYWEERFGPFHKYLEETFPHIWTFCKVEKVNLWGLVITWEGSDQSLQPVLLSAHQDVVPVQDSTIGLWKYPPYQGFYDGDKLWGRGSADCKNLLIGLLETAEELYNSGFRPRRTIIFAFGFDEEIGGERGANEISAFLKNKYGKGAFYAVIDEGGQSLVRQGNVALALIGTSEKGLLNMRIGLNTPGGHSSVPPDHTSIGIVSEMITRFEKNPFHPIFSPRNPTFYEYRCVAEHSDILGPEIRKQVRKADYSQSARKIVADYIYHSSLGSRYLVTTSQAADIISGGVKSNALPEYVEVVVNHRIAVESEVQQVIDRNLAIISGVANDFDVGVLMGNTTFRPKTEKGYISVSTSWELEPAPFTPIHDRHWNLFAGTLRHVYEKICKGSMDTFEDLPVIPSPGMAAGNTDTQHYWDLTSHIYRYRPGLKPSVEAHAHGANEHIPFNSHLQIIAFYFEYLQIVDTEGV